MPKIMPKITTKLGMKVKGRTPTDREPLWNGPEIDGVTESLLSRFLCCRERFRLLVVEGLRPALSFSHRLEYGTMWHVCEEAFAESGNPMYKNDDAPWQVVLKKHCQQLATEYPMDGSKVNHWYQVCKAQFPIYIEYWKKHPEQVKRKPLLQETTFDVPYTLPSGRMVRLRGKWDSVDLVKRDKVTGLVLQENKTKGEIDEQTIQQQLLFDLQTMFYLTALQQHVNREQIYFGERKIPPVIGIRYNVVRRPLSGGKHSIRQHKPTKKNPAGESEQEYYERLQVLIADEPEFFFMRWNVNIGQNDIEKFQQQCLNPLLEQLWDWWQWITTSPSRVRSMLWGSPHFRFPYGVYNPLLEGRSTDLDNYLDSGSMVGLDRVNTLFRELE